MNLPDRSKELAQAKSEITRITEGIAVHDASTQQELAELLKGLVDMQHRTMLILADVLTTIQKLKGQS